MEEGVLIEADVHEHGFEALLDILHTTFENAADDVLVALALDGVFFKDAVLEQGHTAFQFFYVYDD